MALPGSNSSSLDCVELMRELENLDVQLANEKLLTAQLRKEKCELEQGHRNDMKAIEKVLENTRSEVSELQEQLKEAQSESRELQCKLDAVASIANCVGITMGRGNAGSSSESVVSGRSAPRPSFSKSVLEKGITPSNVSTAANSCGYFTPAGSDTNGACTPRSMCPMEN
eukprot:TRINITY_DN118727_c0_g1_i1.p1 TRINITY_DN118727_c0_g1~~TRINITY_DN118727_c0_g1_i1.p1  ORF type:complete len:170 (-),score=25.39 TRINITY_DN118727_c0_g1_i1:115-624(-)